jgi:hypothetical protein
MEPSDLSLYTKTRVSLLNREYVFIGEGYRRNVKVGDILHTRALLEDEVAVHVTKIIDGECAVQEPFLEFLEECMNTCIRWKKRYVVELAENVVERRRRTSRSSENSFDVFQWT